MFKAAPLHGDMSVAEHIVSSEKREFEGSLVFPRQISSWHGRDIAKKAKGRSRNRRYLYVLPGSLSHLELSLSLSLYFHETNLD